MKVWDRVEIELATPGSAVRLASVARHVTDCATRPGKKKIPPSGLGEDAVIHLQLLALTVSHINESNCKLMSQVHYFS